MNIKNLELELISLKIPPDAYCLTGGLPNESFCIGRNGDEWEVYYSERGNKTDLKIFEEENLACEHFLEMVKRQFF